MIIDGASNSQRENHQLRQKEQASSTTSSQKSDEIVSNAHEFTTCESSFLAHIEALVDPHFEAFIPDHTLPAESHRWTSVSNRLVSLHFILSYALETSIDVDCTENDASPFGTRRDSLS